MKNLHQVVFPKRSHLVIFKKQIQLQVLILSILSALTTVKVYGQKDTNFVNIDSGATTNTKKTDFLVRNNNGTWNILYSTGKAFSVAGFTFNQSVIFNGNEGDHILQVADFNGDGKSDIMHAFGVSGSSAICRSTFCPQLALSRLYRS